MFASVSKEPILRDDVSTARNELTREYARRWVTKNTQKNMKIIVEDFTNWMLGKHPDYNVENPKPTDPTWWGRNRLVGKEIDTYLENLTNAHSKFIWDLWKLRHYIPTTMNEAWAYFVFFVYKWDETSPFEDPMDLYYHFLEGFQPYWQPGAKVIKSRDLSKPLPVFGDKSVYDNDKAAPPSTNPESATRSYGAAYKDKGPMETLEEEEDAIEFEETTPNPNPNPSDNIDRERRRSNFNDTLERFSKRQEDFLNNLVFKVPSQAASSSSSAPQQQQQQQLHVERMNEVVDGLKSLNVKFDEHLNRLVAAASRSTSTTAEISPQAVAHIATAVSHAIQSAPRPPPPPPPPSAPSPSTINIQQPPPDVSGIERAITQQRTLDTATVTASMSRIVENSLARVEKSFESMLTEARRQQHPAATIIANTAALEKEVAELSVAIKGIKNSSPTTDQSEVRNLIKTFRQDRERLQREHATTLASIQQQHSETLSSLQQQNQGNIARLVEKQNQDAANRTREEELRFAALLSQQNSALVHLQQLQAQNSEMLASAVAEMKQQRSQQESERIASQLAVAEARIKASESAVEAKRAEVERKEKSLSELFAQQAIISSQLSFQQIEQSQQQNKALFDQLQAERAALNADAAAVAAGREKIFGFMNFLQQQQSAASLPPPPNVVEIDDVPMESIAAGVQPLLLGSPEANPTPSQALEIRQATQQVALNAALADEINTNNFASDALLSNFFTPSLLIENNERFLQLEHQDPAFAKNISDTSLLTKALSIVTSTFKEFDQTPAPSFLQLEAPQGAESQVSTFVYNPQFLQQLQNEIGDLKPIALGLWNSPQHLKQLEAAASALSNPSTVQSAVATINQLKQVASRVPFTSQNVKNHAIATMNSREKRGSEALQSVVLELADRQRLQIEGTPASNEEKVFNSMVVYSTAIARLDAFNDIAARALSNQGEVIGSNKESAIPQQEKNELRDMIKANPNDVVALSLFEALEDTAGVIGEASKASTDLQFHFQLENIQNAPVSRLPEEISIEQAVHNLAQSVDSALRVASQVKQQTDVIKAVKTQLASLRYAARSGAPFTREQVSIALSQAAKSSAVISLTQKITPSKQPAAIKVGAN